MDNHFQMLEFGREGPSLLQPVTETTIVDTELPRQLATDPQNQLYFPPIFPLFGDPSGSIQQSSLNPPLLFRQFEH